MQEFLRILEIQAVLLIYLLVGAMCQKRGILDKSSREGLTALLLRVTLPCMVFKSFDQDITPEQLIEVSQMLIIAFIISTLSTILGKLLYRKQPFEKRSVLEYGTLISNCAFAGLPMVSSAYGPTGLLYGAIFVIPTRIFMWSAGVSMFTKSDWRTSVKKVLFNPSIIAVELGLLYMFFPIPIPLPIDTAISKMGDATAPMSMIIIGAILADIDPRTVLDKLILGASGIRLIAIPLVVLAFMRLLGMGELSTQVSVIMTGMPVASTTALLAQQYGADYTFASKCVFVSTVLSLITIPLLSLLL